MKSEKRVLENRNGNGVRKMPNGIDLEGMFRGGSKWSTIAFILATVGLLISVLVTGFLSTYGLNGTLWGLWITLFWLNITTFILAAGVNNRVTAIYLALRGIRDESRFSQDLKSAIEKKDSK